MGRAGIRFPRLWEKLVLDGFQAGLAWITILRKRDAFRAAFDNFDPEKVALYGAADRARLMADAGIVRSNAKIDAAIQSAKIYLAMRDAGEDFSEFCWSFTGGKPLQNDFSEIGQVPAKTALAEEVAKALKARGFKFVGPVIVLRLDAGRRHGQRPHDLLLPPQAGAGLMARGPTLLLERAFIDGHVCGVDEAGRGPWAGPVSAAAVILNPKRSQGPRRFQEALGQDPRGAGGRDQGQGGGLVRRLRQRRGDRQPQHPARRGPGHAPRRRGAVGPPAYALVDGNYRFKLPCEVKTVVGGDGKSKSIAAASILAKVARDRLMIEMDRRYPGYGFASHKGYHAQVHVERCRRSAPARSTGWPGSRCSWC